MKVSLLLIAIILPFVSSIASAQIVGEMVTDRPDLTESTSVVPVGSTQIETGVLYVKDYYRWTIISPELLVRIGATDNLELRFTGKYIHDLYQLGFTDYVDKGIGGVSAGAKIGIAKERGWMPGAAFIGHLLLPVGSAAFRPRYVAPEFRFAFSHSLGDAFTLGGNIGGEWSGNGGSGAGVYALTLGLELWPGGTGYVEAYGSMWGDGRPSHLLDGGITIRTSPSFQFDASFALPFTERGPDYYANTGFTLRLPE